MNPQIVWTGIATAATALTLGAMAVGWERRRQKSQVEALSKQVSLAENRSTRFKEALELVKNEAAELRRDLDHEVQAKQKALVHLAENGRSRLWKTGVLSVVAGFVIGGTLTGFFTMNRMQLRHLEETMLLQVQSQAAVARAEYLEKRLGVVETHLDRMHVSLREEMEKKALAEAKLDTIYQNLGAEEAGPAQRLLRYEDWDAVNPEVRRENLSQMVPLSLSALSSTALLQISE